MNPQWLILIMVAAYFLVSRIAQSFKGPVLGILAALRLPTGVLLGVLLFTLRMNPEWLILIMVAAYFLVSRTARRKGFKGPVPGILAALSFPAGVLLGVLLLTLVSGSYPYTEPYADMPLVLVLAVRDAAGKTVKEWAHAVPVITGLLLLATVILYFRFGTPRKLRFPFGVLGIVLVAVGFLLAIEGIGHLLWNLWDLVGGGCFILAARCFALSKRRRAQSADRVLMKDTRQPVLLLRSFSADTRLSADAVPSAQPPRRLPWSAEKTLEETLVDAFSRRLGPVIALGNPEDYLPQLGAARTYPHDSDWFDVFESLAHRAQCILIFPEVSNGLLRELRWIRENIEPARVYFLDSNMVSKWSDFLAKMHETGFEISGGSPGGVSIWGFTNTWCAYPAGRDLATPVEYAEAVVHALNHGPAWPEIQEALAARELARTAREREKRLRRSSAYAFGRWLAGTAHRVYSPLFGWRSNGA